MMLEIRNFTAYDTEDIRAIYETLREHFKRERIKLRGAPGSHTARASETTRPRVLEVAYWQGDRRKPHANVKCRVILDVERQAHLLKIKKPHRLNLSPVELLALAADNPTLPDSVVEEIQKALATIFSWGLRKTMPGLSVRIHEKPEQLEDKDTRAARVKAKKVRKAVNAALSVGLRMGQTLPQLGGKIERLEAIEDLLSPLEKELLEALRMQQAGMQSASSIAERLKDQTTTP
jgi:hypothetical protein